MNPSVKEIEELAETLYIIRDDKTEADKEIPYGNLEQWVRDMYYKEAQRLIKCGYRKQASEGLQEVCPKCKFVYCECPDHIVEGKEPAKDAGLEPLDKETRLALRGIKSENSKGGSDEDYNIV